MVWCGVVWWQCGVVWCGVWSGVVWCGVVWCGVVWCGVVWCGVVWCDVVWCGDVWCGVVWCDVGMDMGLSYAFLSFSYYSPFFSNFLCVTNRRPTRRRPLCSATPSRLLRLPSLLPLPSLLRRPLLRPLPTPRQRRQEYRICFNHISLACNSAVSSCVPLRASVHRESLLF